MCDNITIRSNNKSHTIHCVVVSDQIWYRAKDVAIALGYKHTNKAVIKHVIIDSKRRLNELKPQDNLGYRDANSIDIKRGRLALSGNQK